MPITCKICCKEFSKLISNTHLKTHNISTAEYKQLHGKDSLSCTIYRNQLSESRIGEKNSNYSNKWSTEQKQNASIKHKGKTPWNKGKKVSTTEKMVAAVMIREEKYKLGILKRVSTPHTDETKTKISIAVTEYCSNNKELTKERTQRAVETKKQKCYDFGSVMRGKKHSAATKEKIKISANISNLKKSELALSAILENIKSCNLSVICIIGNVVTLKCNKCSNDFSITRQNFTDSKLSIDRCPYCHPPKYSNRSIGESELFEYVKSIAPDAISNVRNIIGRLEIDIFIPSKMMGIEYNGLYWHSEDVLESVGKSKYADNEKRNLLLSKNIQYTMVFEDEWLHKKDIVKSRIANILNATNNKIYARNCTINEISSSIASRFCRDNHIQSSGRSNVRYGLYYQNKLVSVMTFSNNNLSRKIKSWEINRFCNKIGTSVVGGASKLFKHFIKIYAPSSVISYADSRWSIGNLYKTLGFKFVKDTPPNYWYFYAGSTKRIHRFTLRKQINESSLTEKELRKNQGYHRIWDCGSSKWQWNSQ